MLARFLSLIVVALSLVLVAGCANETPLPCPDESPVAAVTGIDTTPTPIAGTTHDIVFSAQPACQVDGETYSIEVTGGGRVEPASVTFGKDGKATTKWTLGPAPIAQTIAIGDLQTKYTALPRAKDAKAEPFGDVDGWMTKNKLEGSTEDLAIGADGSIVLGIPGGLIKRAPDGTWSKLKTTGDAIERALGIAYDKDGNLWVVDSDGKAVRKVDLDGKVTTPLTTNGQVPLQSPNYIAVAKPVTGPNPPLFVSDPCLGELIYFTPSGKVLDRHAFDPKTEGGPNGFASDAGGFHVYVVTENTALLCPDAPIKPGLTDTVAGLYRIPYSATKFGKREEIQLNLGMFGDGMAFDALGNLFVTIITANGLALDESRIMVLRKGETKLTPFIVAKDRVMTNLAFGRGPLGETTLYTALLAIPPFTDATKRGMMKVDLGIKGQPLL